MVCPFLAFMRKNFGVHVGVQQQKSLENQDFFHIVVCLQFLDARSSLFRRFAPYDRTKIGQKWAKIACFCPFFRHFTMSNSEICGIFGSVFDRLRGICEIKSPRIEFSALFQEVFFGYLWYYNNKRIILKLKMSPIQYRTHPQIS